MGLSLRAGAIHERWHQVLRMGERQRPVQVRVNGLCPGWRGADEQQLSHKMGGLSSFSFCLSRLTAFQKPLAVTRQRYSRDFSGSASFYSASATEQIFLCCNSTGIQDTIEEK